VITTLAATLLTLVFTADVTSDPALRAGFRDMLHDVRSGFAHVEEAAFIVRLPNGHLTLVRWPSSQMPDEAVWIGAFPRGTIAIVHTHPNWLPRPSNIDALSAKRAGVAIYVLTRSAIVKTTGGEPQVVAGEEWID
jgi:hypothetical protein